MIGGRVLDASALEGFALARPYPQALVWTAVDENIVLVIPAAALSAAWARTPPEVYDALDALLNLPNTVIEALDRAAAAEVGERLAATGRPDAVSSGQVACCALRRGWPVVTGDPEPLRAFDKTIEVDELP